MVIMNATIYTSGIEMNGEKGKELKQVNLKKYMTKCMTFTLNGLIKIIGDDGMNQIEMLQALMENNKKKARMIKDNKGSESLGCYISTMLVVNEEGRVAWMQGKSFYIVSVNDKSEWEIIEPKRKLKEMCFGEAYYEFMHADTNLEGVRSVLTGSTLTLDNGHITKEEYTGKWTIEGIYEDESEDK